MAWLVHEFGWQRLLEARVVLPTAEEFPDTYHGTEEDARALLAQFCGYAGVDPNGVELTIYRGKTRGERLTPHADPRPGWAGLYERRGRKTVVWLEESRLDDPFSTAATFCHELAHARLLGEDRLTARVRDHEPLTDLLTVFLGLGVFTANAFLHDRSTHLGHFEMWSVSRQGYLNGTMFGYALSLFAWVREETKPAWASHLRPDVRSPFKNGLGYLRKTNDSTFSREGDLRPDYQVPYPATKISDGPREDDGRDDGCDQDCKIHTQADELFTDGMALALEGDFEGAARAFTRAIRLNPDDPEFYHQRSLAYLETGRAEEALADAEEAVRLEPDEIENRRARGISRYATGAYESAIEDFEWIVKQERHDQDALHRKWHALYWRGRARAARGDLRGALRDFGKAIQAGPTFAETYAARSRAYSELGMAKQAARDREEAIRRGWTPDKDDSEARNGSA